MPSLSTPLPLLPFSACPLPGGAADPLPLLPAPFAPGDGREQAWCVLYEHLSGLSSLYSRSGLRRVVDPLHDIVVGLTPYLQREVGPRAVSACAGAACSAVASLDDLVDVLSSGREVGWWSPVLQASMALGCWYGMAPGVDPLDREFLHRTSRDCRLAFLRVYAPGVLDALQDAACGPGQEELHGLVADGLMALAPPELTELAGTGGDQ